MLRGELEEEWPVLPLGPSVEGSPEDKQTPSPCIRKSAKISRRVNLALYTSKHTRKRRKKGRKMIFCNRIDSIILLEFSLYTHG